MPTKTDMKRLLKKGLTGKEAARLILQDSWEVDNERGGFLSESDIQAIKGGLKTAEDIQDYNKWVELYRLISYSLIDVERAYLWIKGAIWEVYPVIMSFYMDHQVRQLSFQLPKIVTPNQYENIQAAQRQRRIEEILSLWEVLDWLDVNENDLVSAEILKEWEEYENTDPAEDEDGDLYDSLFEWLYYKRPADFAAIYPPHLIQLIQEGRLQPIMLSASERKDADEDWQATVQSIYKRKQAKPNKRNTAALIIKQLERLRDGRMNTEEGEQLLQFTYCSGQELYKAGIASWMHFVDDFNSGLDDPYHAYVIAQEESLARAGWLDSNGYYDQARQDQLISYLSDLDIFQQAFKRLDREGPGSGLETYLMAQYTQIRIRLKTFLAFHSVIEACSEITGIPFVEKLEEWHRGIEGLVDTYNFLLKQANLSGQNKFYKGPELKLPLLKIDKLKPDPEQLQYMRERMAIALGPDWFKDTALRLIEETSVLTAEEIKEIRDEQERKGHYSPFMNFPDTQEAADD